MKKKRPAAAPLPATCSAVEAAAYLQCTTKSIVKMIRAGIIPGAFICRKWVIPVDALTAYYAGKIEVPRKR